MQILTLPSNRHHTRQKPARPRYHQPAASCSKNFTNRKGTQAPFRYHSQDETERKLRKEKADPQRAFRSERLFFRAAVAFFLFTPATTKPRRSASGLQRAFSAQVWDYVERRREAAAALQELRQPRAKAGVYAPAAANFLSQPRFPRHATGGSPPSQALPPHVLRRGFRGEPR